MFALDLLHVGATGQEELLTAIALGTLVSGVLLISCSDRLAREMLMLGDVATYGFSF